MCHLHSLLISHRNLMSILCSKNRSLIFAARRRNTHELSAPQPPHNWSKFVGIINVTS
jgi:hypothetical protein